MTTTLISFHVRIAEHVIEEEATCIFAAGELLGTILKDILVNKIKVHRVI